MDVYWITVLKLNSIFIEDEERIIILFYFFKFNSFDFRTTHKQNHFGKRVCLISLIQSLNIISLVRPIKSDGESDSGRKKRKTLYAHK